MPLAQAALVLSLAVTVSRKTIAATLGELSPVSDSRFPPTGISPLFHSQTVNSHIFPAVVKASLGTLAPPRPRHLQIPMLVPSATSQPIMLVALPDGSLGSRPALSVMRRSLTFRNARSLT